MSRFKQIVSTLAFATLAASALFTPIVAHAQAYENLEPLRVETTFDASASAKPPYATTPVDRYATVDTNLYRGAAPSTLAAMKGLKAAGIKTIVNYQTDNKKIAQEAAWAKQLGMKHISIPMSGFWAPHDRDVALSQKLLNDTSLRPLFFHCTHGRERTGLQAALYRVNTQGWTPKRAYQEWKDMGFRTLTFPMKDYFEDATQTDL